MVHIAAWYKENVNAKDSNSFILSMMHVLEQISICPIIGMIDRKNSNARFEYRCFLIHPRYRIIYKLYLQPIITQYFIDNKSEIWLLFLIAHSKR